MNVEDISGPVPTDQIRIIHKGWGYERVVVNSPLYCGKELYFFSGRSCSFHYHRLKDETFLVKSGLIRIRWITPVGRTAPWWQDERVLQQSEVTDRTPQDILYQASAIRTLSPGDVFHVPVGMIHQMTGLGDSSLMEFSTHHEDSDSYRLLPGN